MPLTGAAGIKRVGYVKSNGVGMYSAGGLEVSLFDDKYRGSFSRFHECVGFVRGVESVLRHLTAAPEQTALTVEEEEAA